MQAMGCELSAEDIYSINHSSLKDAIVSFGGFCTGEFISSKGLVLTNHHCGYGQIQKQSSMEHNYLKDGFWANSMAEELKNPGLFVEQLVYMEDVTNEVMSSTNKAEAMQNLIAAKKDADPALLYEVVPFFEGNQYYLLATKKYNDVRLVGAPPSSIGKYGADTDNWVFPRHTGDFSLFRVYDEAGVPFSPAQHLKVNVAPRTPGEFTMVFGYPGRTQEYLTAVEMDQLVNVENARRVEIRDVLLSIMDAEMRADAAVQLKYASKYARIANGWKKWIGQIEGVAFTKGVDRKRKLEAEFTARIAADANLWDKYGSLLNDIAVVSTQMSEGTYKRNEFIETVYYGMEWFNLANRLGRMEGEVMNAAILSFDKDFSYEVSAKTTAAMLDMATTELPEIAELTGDASAFNTAVHNELKAITAAAQRGDIFELDSLAPKMAAFTAGAFGIYRANSPSAELASKASELKSTYMKALIEVFPERNFYPNANSTLRVTYGKLEGVSPRDAVSYGTTTYLGRSNGQIQARGLRI